MSDSESESETYGGLKAQAQVRKQRRKLLSGPSSSAPSRGEIRFSTRRPGRVTNYNIDQSEDEFVESDDENAGYEYEAPIEDYTPEIDKVLRHRLRQGAPPGSENKEDYEYNIKWQGKAYYHAVWQPYTELSSLRGAKRLRNYFDSIIRTELRMQNDEEISLEDKEQWNLDREQSLDSLNDYVQVERVIDVSEGEDETEYLVKWKALNYDQCTWEAVSLVSELNQREIDRYLDRTAKHPMSNKMESNPNTRSSYKPFREQPKYIRNGQLRDFQITGVNFLAHSWCKGDSVILADEMGLGKTVQTVSFLSWLRHDRGQQGPFLVVVPLSTMPAWAETFDYWAPDTNYVIYTGNEASRNNIRDKELFVDGNTRRTKFHVLLTTYDYITMKTAWTSDLQQIKWQFLAVDEAHRLKNQASQLYEKLIDLGAPSRLLITGTPVQNNLGELSALMNFLMPGRVVGAEDIDLSSDAASHQINELTQQISPYIIRRTKQKVENDLPPKTEKIIRVELSDVQLEYYKNIFTRNYAALSASGGGHKQSLINIVIELKKASNHPFMFQGVEDQILGGNTSKEDVLKALITSSGKVMLLDQLLTKMKKDGHRVLIFSQMVRMLDILSDYLKARGHQYQRLDGTIAAGARKLAMDHFNAPDSKDFCFLLSTRAGGLGINLMTADTVILFDSDWNPQADLQAMARAHRIGQKKPVTVYRFVSKDTIEEEIIERARNKLMLEFITIQRGVTDKDTSNFKERIAEAKRITDAPNDPDDINRILKRRGQKMFEQTDNQKKLEALDIDAVLANAEEHQTEQPEGLAADGGEDFLKSFEYTDVKVDLEWDEIIPKEQLEAIKAEEKKKEEEKSMQAALDQNAPRKRKATSDDQGKTQQRAAKKRARERVAAEKAARHEDEDESSGLSEVDEDKIVDPNKALTPKETRGLLRAFEKFGFIDEAPAQIMKAASLEDRNLDLLRRELNEIIHIAETRTKEEQDRLDEIQRTENRLVTKKDRKAVLFTYNRVQRINAETLLERPKEMHMLRDFIGRVKDVKTFRIPEATKPASYTSDWGAREDGMLVVGVARHGYGAWADIGKDEELALGEKFYLEEHQVARKEERGKAEKTEDKNLRSPGAVHLVRRMNYLFNVLRDKTSNGTDTVAKKALENHHRNTKKWGGSTPSVADRVPRASYSASPAPGAVPKPRSANHQTPLGQYLIERQHSQPKDRDRQKESRRSPDNQDRSRDRDRPPSATRASEHVRHQSNGRSKEPAKPPRPQPNGAHHRRTDSDSKRPYNKSPETLKSSLPRDHRDRHEDRPRSDHRDRHEFRGRRDDRDRYEHRDRYDDRDRYERRDRFDERDRPDHRDRYVHKDHSEYRDRQDTRERRDDRDRTEHRDWHDHRDRNGNMERRDDKERAEQRDRHEHRDRNEDKERRDDRDRVEQRDRNENKERSVNRQVETKATFPTSDPTGPRQLIGFGSSGDAELKAFFDPMASEIKTLREKGSKKSGLTPAERTKFLGNGLITVGNHISEHAPDKGKIFLNKAW